ncbi:MAG: glycosyltransferase [Anaerolineales bacterium]
MSDRFLGQDITPRTVLGDITLIIPTLGRDLLMECLESVATGCVWPARLIVVDQSSSAKVSSWVDEMSAIGINAGYLPSSETGTAAATNRGIERVETCFLAVTHDDCIVAPDWLKSLHFQLLKNFETVVTGRVEPGGSGVTVSIKTSTIPESYRKPLLKEDVLFPNNFGCERSVFSKVGLFDESYYLRFAEDNDWSYRALRAGVPIVYAPEVIVKHLDWRDNSRLIATYGAYARSQGGFFGKHLRRGDLFIALRIAIGLVRGFYRWVRGILSDDPIMIASGWYSMTKMPSGVIAGLRGRD